MNEPRVMPGMFLGYQPDKRSHESLLYVLSVRRAREWTTAKLRGFSGTGEVWAITEYSVRFPDHAVRDPFRVVTARDLKPKPNEREELFETPEGLRDARYRDG